MLVIEGRNVNETYAKSRALMHQHGVPQPSRAGDVLVAPFPVMTVHRNPTEYVLWDAARDANPFFHLFESIFHLAGRDDAAFLNRYVRDFGERFAEPGGRLHGAYGARWRWHWEHDQLRVVVERLRRDPNDRRVVLSMWDPDHDLWSRDQWLADGGHESDYVEPRDLPCNTHVYPRVRSDDSGRYLDLTVCCRSNDLIYGCLGANVVHFGVLLEYLAAAVGVRVGAMYQLSNNWHAYVDVLDRTENPDQFQRDAGAYEDLYLDRGRAACPPRPMVTDAENFLRDCENFCDDPTESDRDVHYHNPWFAEVATPMARTHALWRAGKRDAALMRASEISAPDWRLAVERWMQRRTNK